MPINGADVQKDRNTTNKRQKVEIAQISRECIKDTQENSKNYWISSHISSVQ